MKPPKIEFPCDYPIKIIGNRTSDFEAIVQAVVRRFALYDADRNHLRESGKGNYCALTIWIEAQSEEQLQDIFLALKDLPEVTMVL